MLQNINSLLGDEIDAVNDVIRRRLYSEVALVRQVAEYIVNSGGKRLRPLLVLLCANALQKDVPLRHNMAAVVEFIHTATLLHDDVVDESGLRRGRKTANALFGNAASVLVGDYLYSRSFQMMVEIGDMAVMQIMAEATNTIAEGEVLQLMNCCDSSVDEERYLQVIRFKTARLFQAAAECGAVLAGASAEMRQSLANYGMHLGTAFQLIDDLLDYSGAEAEIGKQPGDDLTEGKPTLPLIRMLQVGNEGERAMIRDALENGGADAFEAVRDAIQSTDALSYTRQRAISESEAAKQAISNLKPSKYQDALLELAVLAIERNS